MGRLLTALSRKTGINKLMLALPCLPSPGKQRPSVSTGELRKLAPDRGARLSGKKAEPASSMTDLTWLSSCRSTRQRVTFTSA